MSKVLNRPSPKGTIEVPAEVAQAYAQATPEQKERVLQSVRFALMTGPEAAEEFWGLTDKLAHEAERRGLTPEMIDQLLDADE